MKQDNKYKESDTNRINVQAVVTGENRRMTDWIRDHVVIIDLPQVSGSDNEAPARRNI